MRTLIGTTQSSSTTTKIFPCHFWTESALVKKVGGLVLVFCCFFFSIRIQLQWNRFKDASGDLTVAEKTHTKLTEKFEIEVTSKQSSISRHPKSFLSRSGSEKATSYGSGRAWIIFWCIWRASQWQCGALMWSQWRDDNRATPCKF